MEPRTAPRARQVIRPWNTSNSQRRTGWHPDSFLGSAFPWSSPVRWFRIIPLPRRSCPGGRCSTPYDLVCPGKNCREFPDLVELFVKPHRDSLYPKVGTVVWVAGADRTGAAGWQRGGLAAWRTGKQGCGSWPGGGCWVGSSRRRDRGCGKWPRAWACIALSTWPVAQCAESGRNREAASQLEVIREVSEPIAVSALRKNIFGQPAEFSALSHLDPVETPSLLTPIARASRSSDLAYAARSRCRYSTVTCLSQEMSQISRFLLYVR